MTLRSPWNLLFLCFGALLLFYVGLRAHRLSFTHDESLTYTIVTGSPSWVNSANNHIFNTQLVKLCDRLFGNSEFSLRLPNVLAFLIYFAGCFYLLTRSSSTILKLLGFAVLFINPFFLDFFSLARGYGLSFAFMILSVLYLLVNNPFPSKTRTYLRNVFLSLFFGALAVYSNLGIINYYIACITIHFFSGIIYLWKYQKAAVKDKMMFAGVLIVSIVPLLLAVKWLLHLKQLDQLYFGGPTLEATVFSLVYSSMYFSKNPEWLHQLLSYAFIFSFPTAIIAIVVRKDYYGRFALITCILLLIFAGLMLEHFLFEAKYPSERTALFLVPLFGLFIYYFAEHLLKFYARGKLFLNGIFILVTFAVCYHFFLNANLGYCKTWSYDAHTKNVMSIVEKESRGPVKQSLSNNWLFEPAINFYIYSKNINVHPVNRDGVNLTSDFIYKLDEISVPENYSSLYECQENDVNVRLLKKIAQ
jgi:hypothetical protein